MIHTSYVMNLEVSKNLLVGKRILKDNLKDSLRSQSNEFLNDIRYSLQYLNKQIGKITFDAIPVPLRLGVKVLTFADKKTLIKMHSSRHDPS